MNAKLRPLAAFLMGFSVAAPLPALAANTDFRPAGSTAVVTTDIQLVQQASLVVPRDRITATLQVTMRGPDARTIQVEINRRMVAALAKVKDMPAVVAETGSYSVNHPYSMQGPSRDWQGGQTLILTSGDIEAVLNLAGQLQNDGLVMGEMRFFVSPDSLKAVQDELTASALKTMQDRAGTIAGDLGLKVSRYKSVTVGNAQEQLGETPTSKTAPPQGASRKAPPPAAIAGEALVTLNVNATVMMSP